MGYGTSSPEKQAETATSQTETPAVTPTAGKTPSRLEKIRGFFSNLVLKAGEPDARPTIPQAEGEATTHPETEKTSNG